MATIRTKHHDDGRIELIRLISANESWSVSDPLAFEKSIVWLRPIDDLTYVRESYAEGVRSRNAPIRVEGSAELIGYATLTADAPLDATHHGYRRRIFYLRSKDPVEGRPPSKAVDPRTVLPGVAGKRLRRSRR